MADILKRKKSNSILFQKREKSEETTHKNSHKTNKIQMFNVNLTCTKKMRINASVIPLHGTIRDVIYTIIGSAFWGIR